VRDALRRLTDYLARLPDTPERLAFAFGLGAFLGFSPFVGLQTLLGLGVAYAMGLSRVAVVAGTWVNLPWLVPVYYVLATEAGARLLGMDSPSTLAGDMTAAITESGFGFAAIRRLFALFRPMLWPFALGSTLGGLIIGFLSHRVMLLLLRASRGGMPAVAVAGRPPDDHRAAGRGPGDL
jgi:uncharacterized protein (DUF2062 family)